jgi:transcriptional regulator with XRE-family HTH domain
MQSCTRNHREGHVPEEELFGHVGRRIRELRGAYNSGAGLSQEALAAELDTTANTISRWETATYQPGLGDLDRLARFFGVSILSFFPGEKPSSDEKVAALLRTASELPESDIEELRKFAEFRRAQTIYGGSRPRPGRKPSLSSRKRSP